MGQTVFDAYCVNVIDGDTIEVRWRRRRRKVRILGIDTPETHNHSKRRWRADKYGLNERRLKQLGVRCSSLANTNLDNVQVQLVFPERVGDTDRYNRLLAYVEVRGVDFGRSLVREGMAFPRLDPHPRLDDYLDAFRSAKEDGIGIFQGK